MVDSMDARRRETPTPVAGLTVRQSSFNGARQGLAHIGEAVWLTKRTERAHNPCHEIVRVEFRSQIRATSSADDPVGLTDHRN